MSFCSEFEPGFKKQIIDLLYDGLFKMSSNGCLEEWYDLMTLLFDCDNKVWEYVKNNPKYGTINVNQKKKDALFECDKALFSSSSISSSSILPLFQYPNFGHDVPVWLEEDNNDNDSEDVIKIMIVSQDPLRDRGAIGKILFSSPFGVHCRDYRTQPREYLMKIIGGVWKTAKANNKKVIFYLTDLYKAFALDPQNENKKSIDLMSSFKGRFVDVFEKEIDLYKPNLILLMGAEVANVLLGATNYIKTQISGSPRKMTSLGDYFNPYYTHSSKHINSNIRVIPILHTSGNDHGQKKLAVDYLKGKGELLPTDGIKEMFVKLIMKLI